MEDEVKKLREITNQLSALLEEIKTAVPHHEQDALSYRMKRLTNVVVFAVLLGLTLGLSGLAILVNHVYFP